MKSHVIMQCIWCKYFDNKSKECNRSGLFGKIYYNGIIISCKCFVEKKEVKNALENE